MRGNAVSFVIREPQAEEHVLIERFLNQSWGSTTVVSRGGAHDASQLPALVADQDGEIVGLATYRLAEDSCELVTLDSLKEGQGVGSALLAGVSERAGQSGCTRVWLITSNDNVNAVRFYQRRGMRLVAVHRGATQ